MVILIAIIIVLACAVLAFLVLIQNPKGGGLAGSFSGLGNQMMGVKQSTDIVEKSTWVTASIIAVLILGSFVIYPKQGTKSSQLKSRSEEALRGVNIPSPQAPTPQPAPAQTPTPAPGN